MRGTRQTATPLPFTGVTCDGKTTSGNGRVWWHCCHNVTRLQPCSPQTPGRGKGHMFGLPQHNATYWPFATSQLVVQGRRRLPPAPNTLSAAPLYPPSHNALIVRWEATVTKQHAANTVTTVTGGGMANGHENGDLCRHFISQQSAGWSIERSCSSASSAHTDRTSPPKLTAHQEVSGTNPS